MCVPCVRVYMRVPQCMYGGQRADTRQQFPLSTTWISRVESEATGLAANVFAH